MLRGVSFAVVVRSSSRDSCSDMLVKRPLVCREIWNHFTSPGTFHALMLAVQGLLAGNGWQYVPPQGRAHKVRKLRHKKSNDGQQKLGSSNALSW
jgi:hypothetical protein